MISLYATFNGAEHVAQMFFPTDYVFKECRHHYSKRRVPFTVPRRKHAKITSDRGTLSGSSRAL